MRLINAWTFDLEEFDEDEVPEYAILSHTWEYGEVSYAEMQKPRAFSVKKKNGYGKIACAAKLALEDDLLWIWVDTCCIDKSSSAELQEAINSMWRWYSNARVCYVFISDLPENPLYLTDEGVYRNAGDTRTLPIEESEYPAPDEKFIEARWFSRGWCLQELIAPQRLLFYSFGPFGGECKLIGDRSLLLKTISAATNIDVGVLQHKTPLRSMSVAQRMSWAANRQTRRLEDQAYCLLGIFDVSMPMLYGEGKKAFIRLQEEIMRNNSDHSLFAWERLGSHSDGSLLATSPSDFANASRIVQWGHPQPFEMTNRGLRICLPLILDRSNFHPTHLAILNCRYNGSLDSSFALRLDEDLTAKERHVFASTLRNRLVMIPARDVKYAAPPTDLLIARKYEPRSASVRIMLYLEANGPDRSIDFVKDVFTEQDVSRPSAPVFLTTQKAVARAGVMLQYPSGRQFSLVFGFDRYPPNDSKGVLLPGVWAKFHRGPQRLKDIIKLEPIHAHGRGSTCKDPRKDGCPYMPKTASVSLLPEGDMLDAEITHERILDEDVFIVRADVKRMHEMEAGQGSTVPQRGGDCSTDLMAPMAKLMTVTEAFEYRLINGTTPKTKPAVLQERFDPFIPDVRYSVFAGPQSSSQTDSTSLPAGLGQPSTPPKDPAAPAETEQIQHQPFYPEVQRSFLGCNKSPTPVGESFDSWRAFDAFIPDVTWGHARTPEPRDRSVKGIAVETLDHSARDVDDRAPAQQDDWVEDSPPKSADLLRTHLRDRPQCQAPLQEPSSNSLPDGQLLKQSHEADSTQDPHHSNIGPPAASLVKKLESQAESDAFMPAVNVGAVDNLGDSEGFTVEEVD